MKITVTQEHINTGKRGEAESCAIALAVKQFGYVNVIVGDDGGMDVEGNKYYLGMEAKKFITDFDAGKKVEPFEFEAYYVDENA